VWVCDTAGIGGDAATADGASVGCASSGCVVHETASDKLISPRTPRTVSRQLLVVKIRPLALLQTADEPDHNQDYNYGSEGNWKVHNYCLDGPSLVGRGVGLAQTWPKASERATIGLDQIRTAIPISIRLFQTTFSVI
jgi:hypothetical protein